MDSGAEGRDHALDFFIGIDSVNAGFFYIQHLAPERHDCLIANVAAVLCRTQSGISLYDENFAFFRIFFRAVGKLTRQTGTFEYGFSSRQLPGFSRSGSRSLCKNRFLTHYLCNLRILLKEISQLLGNDPADCC